MCHNFWAIGGILCCHNIFRLDRRIQATVSHLFCLMLHFCHCLCAVVEMSCCKLKFHCWWVILTSSISTLLHGNGKFIQATLTGFTQAMCSCQLLWLLLFYDSYLRKNFIASCSMCLHTSCSSGTDNVIMFSCDLGSQTTMIPMWLTSVKML